MAAILADAIVTRTVGSASQLYRIRMNPDTLAVLTVANSGIKAAVKGTPADDAVEAYTDVDELALSEACTRISISGKSGTKTITRRLIVAADKTTVFRTALEAGLTIKGVTYNKEHTPRKANFE